MSLETDNPQYATGKLICEDILRTISGRWKTAGKDMIPRYPLLIVMHLLTDYVAPQASI